MFSYHIVDCQIGNRFTGSFVSIWREFSINVTNMCYPRILNKLRTNHCLMNTEIEKSIRLGKDKAKGKNKIRLRPYVPTPAIVRVIRF